MIDVDPKANDRAAKLIKDARNNTYGGATKRALNSISNFIGSVRKSGKGWKETHSLKGMVGETISNSVGAYGGFVAGSALAVAIGTAGTLASVASFGIVPALTIVGGLIAKSGIGAYRYHKSSNKVINAVKNGGSLGPDLVVAGTKKVMKKFERVEFRNKVLSSWGWRKAWNWKNTYKGYKKNKKGAVTFLYHKDVLLDERLLELRYYGQMLFGVVEKMIEGNIKARENYAQAINLLYQYTIRQVHFSGNHRHCGKGKCYNINIDDFYNLQMQMQDKHQKGLYKVSDQHMKQFLMDQNRMNKTNKSTDAKVLLKKLEDLAHSADKTPEIKEDEKLKNRATKLQWTVGLGGKVKTQELIEKAVHTSGDISKELFKKPGALGAKALGMASAGVMDLAVDEIMKSVDNRMARRKILKTKESALGLLEMVNSGNKKAQEHILKDLIKNKKKSFKAHAQRAAEKIHHYYVKLAEMDKESAEIIEILIRWGKEKQTNPFDSCDQAWLYNAILQHTFENYNKFMTHLVYFECLLLQMDLLVAEKVKGISKGQIVKEGANVTKPGHLKVRHGDLINMDPHDDDNDHEDDPPEIDDDDDEELDINQKYIRGLKRWQQK